MDTRTILYFFYCLCFFWAFLVACEEEFLPPVVLEQSTDLVVEGYVEAYHTDPTKVGIYPRPVYVVVTRSLPFTSSFGKKEFEGLFVRGAYVTVATDEDTIVLEDICLNELEPSSRENLVRTLGLNSADLSLLGFDFNDTDFCAYIDLRFTRQEIGKTYHLRIEVEDKVMTASTTIPQHNPLDSIAFQLPPGDSAFFSKTDLRQMVIYITDPDSVRNHYRYFTQQNAAPMYKGNASISGFRSVLDDRVFGNVSSSIPLPKGQPRDSTFDTGGNLFGNYRKNDNYILKWCNLDESHFNFWNASEFNALNQGFFSTYTQPPFNIEGGIGVWGGYSISFYKGKVLK